MINTKPKGKAILTQEQFKNLTTPVGNREYHIIVKEGGTTAERPTVPDLHQTYYDTTLNKMVVWNGTAWVDSDSNKLDKVTSGGVRRAYGVNNTNTQEMFNISASPVEFTIPFRDADGNFEVGNAVANTHVLNRRTADNRYVNFTSSQEIAGNKIFVNALTVRNTNDVPYMRFERLGTNARTDRLAIGSDGKLVMYDDAWGDLRIIATESWVETRLATKLNSSAKGETANKTLTFGGTFKVLETLANGTVNERIMTMPAAPTGTNLGTTHNTTSVTITSSTGSNATINAASNSTAGVVTTGAQTFTGTKTFSSSPIVPAPTGNTSAVNKQYVDGILSSVYRPSGDWNATTNTPTLANNTPANAGKVYRVTTAGTQFGLTFAVGDKLAFIEGGVATKWDNVDDVTSVAGKTGNVTLNKGDVGLGNVANVLQLTASNKGETANKTLAFGGTFKVLETLANGTVNERTMTLPANPNVNNYLTEVSGSANGTATFTRQGLSNLTWNTTHGHTISEVSGLQGALDDKSQRIILTGQLQTTSYRRSVIALCELTNTNPSANSYSVGTLTFHRTNGLESAVKYDFAIEKRYNTEGFNLSQTVLANSGFAGGIRPCTFVKNGIKYGGIEVYFSDAELRYIEFHGTTNFEIFGLDYYITNTSTPLDTEVNNSLVFDDSTNIRVADTFKVGNNLVASQTWVESNHLKLTGGSLSGALTIAGILSDSRLTISNKQLINVSGSKIYLGNPQSTTALEGTSLLFNTNTVYHSGNLDYSNLPGTKPPVNAQKNSDITKAEIEAKLTGTINSHTHSLVNSASLLEGFSSRQVSKFGSTPGTLITRMNTAGAGAVQFTQEGSVLNMGIDGDVYVNEGTDILASRVWITENFRDSTWTPTWAQVSGKPDFSTVATSGSFNDLTNKPDPKITLAGDLTGSVTLTDLGSGTLTATIAANSVALGTDTTGNYVATVSGITNGGLSISGSGSENSAVTIGHSNILGAAGSQSGSSGTIAFGGTILIPSISYDRNGHITSTTTTSVTLPGNPNTDTKNTAGATNTSSKIFLVGATSQAANPQTYSDDEVYVTSGTLTTKEVQVGGTAATMKYDSTSKSIKFTFA